MEGSRAGSVPLINGSGSGRPKNFRIRNTGRKQSLLVYNTTVLTLTCFLTPGLWLLCHVVFLYQVILIVHAGIPGEQQEEEKIQKVRASLYLFMLINIGRTSFASFEGPPTHFAKDLLGILLLCQLVHLQSNMILPAFLWRVFSQLCRMAVDQSPENRKPLSQGNCNRKSYACHSMLATVFSVGGV